MKNVVKPLAKSVLILLGLTATASATDTSIHKKMLLSRVTTLVNSNEEMNDIIEIVKLIEKSALLIKSVSETIQNEPREQKDGFLSMLLGTLSVSY